MTTISLEPLGHRPQPPPLAPSTLPSSTTAKITSGDIKPDISLPEHLYDSSHVDGLSETDLKPTQPTSSNPDQEVTEESPIWQYQPQTGEVVFDNFNTPQSDLNRKIIAAFTHNGPGKFKDVTLASLEAEVEVGDGKEHEGEREQHAVKKSEEEEKERSIEAIEGGEQDEEEDVEDSQGMSYEEMMRMKQEVFATLSNAWQELNFISELSRSLIPNQPYPYTDPRLGPPYIPANALTVQPIDSPTIYTAHEIGSIKLALARENENVHSAKNVLDDAVKRMRKRQGKDKKYWDDLFELRYGKGAHVDQVDKMQEEEEVDVEEAKKEGIWPLLPKWTVDGTPENKQIARDVMIPYAVDEAAPHFRTRSLAVLASEDDTEASSPAGDPSRLVLPARRDRRLRVQITTKSGGTRASSRRSSHETTARHSLSETLRAAQEEVFDEEIFDEIVREARGLNLLDARISVDKVAFQPIPGMDLKFEMVETFDRAADESEDDSDSDGVSDLVIAVTRLAMLRIYRHRKALKQAALSNQGPPNPVRPILATIIPYLHFQAFTRQLLDTLEGYKQVTRALGFELQITRNDGGFTGGMDWESLLSDGIDQHAMRSLSKRIDVLLEGRQIVSILISLSCQLTLAFPEATLVSQDLAQLPTFLSNELRKVMLGILGEELKVAGKEFALDETSGTIRTKDVKLAIKVGDASSPSSLDVVAYILERKGTSNPNGTVRQANKVEEVNLTGVNLQSWIRDHVA